MKVVLSDLAVSETCEASAANRNPFSDSAVSETCEARAPYRGNLFSDVEAWNSPDPPDQM